MTHKRNARAPRPDPAAQDPMDYLLDDVMQATDRVAAEFNNMAGLEADPVAALAEHCHTLAGRLAALAEVVRQMRDLQRGLVVISDPPMPAPVLMTEAGQAARTLVRWRMGDYGLEPVYADMELPTEQQVRDGLDAGTNGAGTAFLTGAILADAADYPDAPRPRRWTRAEALAEAERLGGLGGAVFLMHWAKTGGQ